MLRRIMMAGLLISLLMVGLISPVSACSGGAPLTLAGLLQNADYAVKARPVEIDAAGRNAILHIESYLGGKAGPEFVLLVQTDPILTEYVDTGHSSGGDCLGFHAPMEFSDSFYAFIQRQDNGSYRLVTTLFNDWTYTFPEADSTVEVFLEAGEYDADHAERDTGQRVTEAEFIDLIAETSGKAPVAPDTTARYPLKAPLRIDTRDGEYLLPVDWETPIPYDPARHPMEGFGFSDAGTCSTDGCVQISPDNLNIAVQTDANTITFTWGKTLTGQAARFSATSDAVAVWNDCDITVYSTGYPRLMQEWFELKEVNHRTLDGEDCHFYTGQGVWSPDGRMLAYSDGGGLWLWDVFVLDSKPRLLMEAGMDSHPAAQEFSPDGRYVHVTWADAWGNLDILTGDMVPPGIFSPDSRLLIRNDYGEGIFEICVIAPLNCVQTAAMDFNLDDGTPDGRVYHIDRVLKTQWQDNSTFLTLGCDTSETNDVCAVFFWSADAWGWSASFVMQGDEFDYDAVGHNLAVFVDDNRLDINGETLMLENLAPIYSIEWLPSLFYEG